MAQENSKSMGGFSTAEESDRMDLVMLVQLIVVLSLLLITSTPF